MKPFIDLAAQGQVVKSEILGAFSDIIDRAAFIGGDYVERCEQALSDYVGRRCLVVSSGTDALVLALMALGLKPGQAVFVPSFTFAASAEAVALLGGFHFLLMLALILTSLLARLKHRIPRQKYRAFIAWVLFL